MVKGVNRQVLEIRDPGSPYFERAFFFVKPEYAFTGEQTLRRAAAKALDQRKTLDFQELLKDLPNGLQRLAKMGFTELEIFGYREDTGKFGDYNPQNTLFISPKEYKKMADDAGLKITSSHLTPSVRDYIPENMSKFEDFWKKATAW